MNMTFAALALVGAVAPVADRPTGGAAPALPAWLAGCWVEEKGERWTEECWIVPRAGMMMGSGRSGMGEVLREWETTQIVAGDKDAAGKPVALAYWGSPFGRDRTQFVWRADGGPGVTFYNESHDYPQRIRYWREGEVLVAEIALADGSKSMRWRYRRLG